MKKPLYLDLDGVVFNTVKAIVDMYNDDFMYYQDFQPVNWWDIDTWEFKECNFATNDYLMSYFNQSRFFNTYLTLMPFATEVIAALKDKYDIIFVSMGDYANLAQKAIWVDENYPDCGIYLLDLDEPDKSCVDMSNGVFLDDSFSNLKTSNADDMYCFGKERSWNKEWKGERLEDWIDVYNKLY